MTEKQLVSVLIFVPAIYAGVKFALARDGIKGMHYLDIAIFGICLASGVAFAALLIVSSYFT